MRDLISGSFLNEVYAMALFLAYILSCNILKLSNDAISLLVELHNTKHIGRNSITQAYQIIQIVDSSARLYDHLKKRMEESWHMQDLC